MINRINQVAAELNTESWKEIAQERRLVSATKDLQGKANRKKGNEIKMICAFRRNLRVYRNAKILKLNIAGKMFILIKNIYIILCSSIHK